MKRLAAIPLLLLLVTAGFATESMDTMDAEIDFLLDYVETSGCTFIRNGKEHKPESARSHLELKRKRGKRYYNSTEEFIEKIASSSSWSGKPYMIRCGDSEPQPIEGWYMAALSEYRSL
jgi:hypothetical protein